MRTDVVRLGRLSGERTGDMMKFLSSMRSDRYIADSDVLVDIAHVLMLERQKIISTEIAKQLLPALLELNSRRDSPKRHSTTGSRTVHCRDRVALDRSGRGRCRWPDAHGPVEKR